MLGQSMTEQIFTVKQIIKKMNEFCQQAFIVFVDFKAAFNSID